MLRKEDILVLRQLAQEYAAAAALPLQQQKKQLWLKLNHLQMERPMLTIDQIPWYEMDVDGSLECTVQDEYWREVEQNLRRTAAIQIHGIRHSQIAADLSQLRKRCAAAVAAGCIAVLSRTFCP